ncbi:MAG TPA: acetylglutamate kinase [Micromonosporaceae bacterium]|nr:acetylglutamate kinase [Micromonosporaceae bacterium]
MTAIPDQAATAAMPTTVPRWSTRFAGATVVVRCGGHAMTDDALRRAFAADVAFLRYAGLRPVVVPGGVAQAPAMLARLGIGSRLRGGPRVISPEALDIARMVLVGQAGQAGEELAGLVNEYGPLAVAVSGQDGHLFTAVPRPATVDGAPVDAALASDVATVRPSAVEELLAAGWVPVVATVAPDPDGVLHSLDPDAAAAALAVALGAGKLVMLTDVPGLCAAWPDPRSLVPRVSAAQLTELLPDLAGAMVPKMEACLRAVCGGVPAAHVVDGRVAHSTLLEVFTSSGMGTMVTP